MQKKSDLTTKQHFKNCSRQYVIVATYYCLNYEKMSKLH